MFILGAIFGLFGAGLSIISGMNRAAEEQAEISAQKEAEKRMREERIKELRASAEREISYAKSAFKIEQQDAIKKAGDIWHQGERIDMKADLDETLTGRAFNLAIKKTNAAETAMLHTEQRGKQNFENKQGELKASLGLSGTRQGSNSAEQLLTQGEANFNQDLALMKSQRELEKDINLMSAFSSLKSGMFGIDEARDAANMAFRDSAQLRADYSEGGRVVNLFNQKIANRREDLEGNVNLINVGGEIQQQALQRAYNRAEYTFLDGLTDTFKGFSSGWNLGSSITNFAQNWGGFGATPGQAAGVARSAARVKTFGDPYNRGFSLNMNDFR